MQQILQRLDRLEQENRTLSAEVSALRSELAAARGNSPATPPAATEQAAAVPLEERVAVVEQRTADLAQEKVEASHRLPITLTGMVLFNAFINGRANGGQQDPIVALCARLAFRQRGQREPEPAGIHFSGPANSGRGTGERAASSGSLGRHIELVESSGTAAGCDGGD